MNILVLFRSKSSSKPRRDRWIFKLLRYRGLLDVIIFTIVLILKWCDVKEFSKENMFGDFCASGAEERNLIFCRNFIEMAINVRLAAAICLTVGGYCESFIICLPWIAINFTGLFPVIPLFVSSFASYLSISQYLGRLQYFDKNTSFDDYFYMFFWAFVNIPLACVKFYQFAIMRPISVEN